MVTNPAKTKCLLVTAKRIPCKLDECLLELKLVNSEIEQVDSKKILGLTIGKHKGGNFIYPMMHRFVLYYQASERT